jgi:hypothetical protein
LGLAATPDPSFLLNSFKNFVSVVVQQTGRQVVTLEIRVRFPTTDPVVKHCFIVNIDNLSDPSPQGAGLGSRNAKKKQHVSRASAHPSRDDVYMLEEWNFEISFSRGSCGQMAERLLRLTVDQKSLRHRRFESYSAHQRHRILGPKTNGYLSKRSRSVPQHLPGIVLICSSVGRASDC